MIKSNGSNSFLILIVYTSQVFFSYDFVLQVVKLNKRHCYDFNLYYEVIRWPRDLYSDIINLQTTHLHIYILTYYINTQSTQSHQSL